MISSDKLYLTKCYNFSSLAHMILEGRTIHDYYTRTRQTRRINRAVPHIQSRNCKLRHKTRNWTRRNIWVSCWAQLRTMSPLCISRRHQYVNNNLSFTVYPFLIQVSYTLWYVGRCIIRISHIQPFSGSELIPSFHCSLTIFSKANFCIGYNIHRFFTVS
jgi:hypothetical protein